MCIVGLLKVKYKYMSDDTNKSNSLLWIGAAVLAVLLVLAWIFVINRPNSDDQPAAAAGAGSGEEQVQGAELGIEDVSIGTGAEARAGQTVAVHYVGTLTDGTKFDSSRDRGEPFTFTLGAGQVIQGWELGVSGMREGGVRNLVIPPELGYGERDLGAIPPNSTLLFEVELISIVDSKG